MARTSRKENGMSKKYEVIIPWNGVSKGDILELDEVHPSLEANIRMVAEAAPSDADKIIEDAKIEADLILEAARTEAEKIVADARKAAPQAELAPVTPEAKSKK
eukprot:TRINITY_DN67803_c0_g1_i2.p3 TRINITY_DN67803_c0_g1~~TRINITY_DN67803_c0_g1_i2.p3  ORF type:complete len:104 (+),score=35.34 TRINITY_DN67803_c0_g1_i2:140-451(+)